MPLRYLFKSTFQKAFDQFPQEKQILVAKAIEAICQYISSGKASYGLRIKKLHDGGLRKTFESLF